MKKSAIAALVLAGVMLLGGGAVYATGQVARSSAISEETAENFAFVDAGVSPEEASRIKTEFDYDNGKFVYEIEFIAGGVSYEYKVEASSGRIISKETEKIGGASETPSGTNDNKPDPQTPKDDTAASSKTAGVIGIDKAKEIALGSAGLQASDVVFSKAKLERENGSVIYDVEFYIAGQAEYDYEIDAITGEILEESFDEWEYEDYAEYNLAVPEAEKPVQNTQPAANSSAPVSQPSANSGTQTSQPAASSGAPASQPAASSGAQASQPAASSSAPASQPSASSSTPTMISVDQAKSIAASQAGYSVGDLVFSKAKLDWENGKQVYEVEFYVNGVAEYEYDIDAYSGAVVKSDIDRWEPDDDDDDDDDWDD